MSKDLRFKQKCPHQVVEEWLQIEEDRQTLRPVRYPSSQNITLLWNRQEVPKVGLFSTIEVTGLKAEPFEIEAPDNSTLAFSVDGGATQTVTLPTGRSVPASPIVRAINEQTEGVVASVKNGRVTITHELSGPQSTLKMEDGSGHATLGLSDLRFYRSRTVIPGWGIYKEVDNVDPTARVLRFDEPLRTEDDIFEVSYYTIRGVCRRCQGIGIENDFRHNQQGDPIFVRNQTLLLQEVEKIIFTIKGSHVFHQWYGTSISNLVGTKIVGGGDFVEARLATEITNALDLYLQNKEEQARYQPVTDAELLQRIVSINVVQDNNDPTIFDVDIVLESRSGDIEQVQDTLVVANTTFGEGFQRVQ